jgi:flagellar biosynthesis/type III secretory pathway protein FliH
VIPRARILPAPVAEAAPPLLGPAIGKERGRRIAREELEAHRTAERLLQDARATAEAIVAEARARADREAAATIEEAREQAVTQLAARWMALRERERAAVGRDQDLVIRAAVALAERLLGEALALDPSRITGLARGVLDEARGARRAVVEAHPVDADELRSRLSGDGLDLQSLEVRSDAALARGELRLHTDLGIIDARLAPRFERLAAALRDALR